MLDDLVGLHESIGITYVVNGYKATLYTQDDRVEVASGAGETIDDALDHLWTLVSEMTLEEMRNIKP